MVLLNTSYTHTRSMLRGAPAVSVVLGQVVSSCVALSCQVVVVTVRAAPVPRGNPCRQWLWVSHMHMRCCELLCEDTHSNCGCMTVTLLNACFSCTISGADTSVCVTCKRHAQTSKHVKSNEQVVPLLLFESCGRGLYWADQSTTDPALHARRAAGCGLTLTRPRTVRLPDRVQFMAKL